MKKIYSLLATMLVVITAWSQTTYEWVPAGGGSWASAVNWTSVPGGLPRTTPAPNDILVINKGTTMTITAFPGQTIGRLSVLSGTVTLNAGGGTENLTIGDATAANDLVIASTATLIQGATLENFILASNATADISGQLTVNTTYNTGGTSVVTTVNGTLNTIGAVTTTTAANLVFQGTSSYIHARNGGTIPTATWGSTATCNLTGVTGTVPAGITQNFGNFTWNCNQSADLILAANMSIQGNFTVSNTGGDNLILTDNNTNRTLSIGGNYSQTGGTFRATNSGTGDATITITGNFSQSGGEFRGNNDAGSCSLDITGNFSLSGTALCNLVSGGGNSSITVDGDVSISGTSTLRLSESNNQTGTLTVSGNFSHTAGTISETAGGSSSGAIIFTGSSVKTFTSGGTVTGTVNYTVNSGATVQMSAATTIVSGAAFTLSSGSSLGIRSTVGITAAGTNTGNIQTTARTFSTGANYIYNGTANQTTLGTGFPTNLTGRLTIDNSGNTVSLTAARTIANTGVVDLTAGTFAAGTNLTMASTSTITRSAGTMSGTLQGAGAYHVIYTAASKTTASELSGSGLSGLTLNLNANQAVTMNQAKTMSGVLTLTSGILTTTIPTLLTIGTAGSVALPGATSASFVNGPLAKTGATAFTFPVGKSGTGYRNIAISTSADAATTFRAEFFYTTPPAGTLGSGIARKSFCEYWDLTRTAGAGNVNVRLSWEPGSSCSSSQYVTELSSLRVAHLVGGIWVNEGNTGVTGSTASGTVVSGTVTSFSPFTLASANAAANPLPVMFADVRAFEENSGVTIEWSNLTERDLSEYSVEYSNDGRSFTSISKVSPKRNDNEKADYSAFHASPVAGSNYYRIKALEVAGKIIYTKVMRIEKGSSKKGFTLYPNPVIGKQLTIALGGVEEGRYNVRIINSTGQNVFQKNILTQGSGITQTLELTSAMKPGVYTLLISGGNYSESKLFVVQ